MVNKNIIVSTPGYGWENLSPNLNRFDLVLVQVINCAAAQVVIESERASGLVIPSLAMLGIYNQGGEQAIEKLIETSVEAGLSRVVVVSKIADEYRKWEDLSNTDTKIVVSNRLDDNFFVEVAEFLAGKRDEI